MKSFYAKISKIGINPYVGVPDNDLDSLFKQAGKTSGPIPMRGTVNGKRFTQTLVRYQGAWRLYINGLMRETSGIDVGDQAHIKLEFDPVPRIEQMRPKFVQAELGIRLPRLRLRSSSHPVVKRSCAISMP